MVYNGSRIEKTGGIWGQVVKYHYQAPKPLLKSMFYTGGITMSDYGKRGLYRLIGIIFFLLLVKWVYATTYMGRDNADTVYYVCQDNKEVAELLGYDPATFDLSDYNIVARKTEKRTDNVGLYVVMINTDDTFVVSYRAEEYDIFFYSWDFK